MKVALVSEGTYPFTMGGVSVWCDQLIQGLPDHRWSMVALAADGTERRVWPAPDNLDEVIVIPLWGSRPTGRGPHRPGAGFAAAHEAFLRALVTPVDPRSAEADRQRGEFLGALRDMCRYAHDGGDLAAALLTNASLARMMDAWHGIRADADLTLADALAAATTIAQMLRPLAVPAVRADVVHASMNGLSMLVGMAAKWRYGTPLVMSEHGIYLRERYLGYLDEPVGHAVRVLLLSFFRCLAGAAYRITDTLAPHSAYNRRWQLHNGADPARMWTMYNGVDPDDFPPAPVEPTEPTVVFMGRVDPLKDLHTLIRAFALVRARVPAARLRIFGAVPAGNEVYADSCTALIAELGLTGAATLEGRVDTPVRAYHAGHVVALTSISEGFPYTVVESMACGRAVVCTNVGGVAEAVGEAGIVVPPRDFAAVADACVRLLADSALRARLGTAARARVRDRFTLRQSLDAYREVYQRLVPATVGGPVPATVGGPG